MEQFVLLLAVALWSEMPGVPGDTRVTNAGQPLLRSSSPARWVITCSEDVFSERLSARLPLRRGLSLVLCHVPPASLPFIFPSRQPSRLPALAASVWEPLKVAG